MTTDVAGIPDAELMASLVRGDASALAGLELTQHEIALRLGWPLGTIKTRTRRALLRLRAELSGTLGPELALTPSDAADLGAAVEVPDGPR